MTLNAEHKLKVAVVGDVMLDQYQTCKIIGISPEDEMAPKLQPIGSLINLSGGAANTGRCAAAWGVNVAVFGIVGADEEGVILQTSNPNLVTDMNRITTTKLRYVTEKGRQVCRVDREDTRPISNELNDKLVAAVRDFNPDIIIMSDYAKGVFKSKEYPDGSVDYTPVSIRLMKNHPTALTFVDPKGKGYNKYGPAYAITPNQKEFEEAAFEYDGNQERQYFDGCYGVHIIQTKGSEGITHWHRSAGFSYSAVGHVKAAAREVGDPSGCGDAFIAALAVCRGLEYPLHLALRYATAAGAITFDHRGVYAPTRDEIEAEVKRSEYKYVEVPNGKVCVHPNNGA